MGAHDIGGIDGFGPIDPTGADAPFREAWERKACGMTMAFMASGLTTEAELRNAIERLPAPAYFSQSYWERWSSGLATLLVEHGLTTRDELESAAGGTVVLGLHKVDDAIAGPIAGPFEVGDLVRVREWHPSGHTRCPRYAQGKVGTVVRLVPALPVPEQVLGGGDLSAEAVYCVRFAATELWGEGGDARDQVHLDLWQTYLEAA